MSWSTHHISANIEGLLRQKNLSEILIGDDGKYLSDEKARNFLAVRKSYGDKLIKTGGCNNFDPIEKGCMGHKWTDSREGRIKIINELIKEIASRGRKFFYSERDNRTAYIFEKNNRLYMKREHSSPRSSDDIYLHPKNGYSPRNFTHGGTLWSLTKDFKEYIIKGGDTNNNNGYGGLCCTHWGYSEEDMKAIIEKAVNLEYLKDEKK